MKKHIMAPLAALAMMHGGESWGRMERKVSTTKAQAKARRKRKKRRQMQRESRRRNRG